VRSVLSVRLAARPFKPGVVDRIPRVILRFAGPGIAFLVGLGFQVSGWQSAWLAYAFFGVAFLWGVLAAATLEPVLARLPWLRRFSEGRPEFKLAIEDERWATFKHEALVLTVKVRVTNTTRHEKQLRGVIFESLPTGEAQPLSHSVELMRELHAHEARYRQLPGVVEPKDHVTGWYRHAVARQLDGGAPAYRVTVRDELENEYSVTRRGRPSIRRDLSTSWADS
jgi:hypothetical protein